MIVRTASAPVNLGVYGGVDASAVDLDAVLAAVAAAGHAGMELGAPGLFGTPADVARRFAAHGLDVAGAYVPLHLAGDRTLFRRDLEGLRRTLDELAAGGAGAPAILADEGSPALTAHPARRWDDPTWALDADGWATLGERLREAVDIVVGAGLRASFHPHVATFVESPPEVDRVLDAVPVGLTLDTGHLRLVGADPVELVARYADRVDHVHLKDVDVAALRRATDAGRTDLDAWWPETCVPLGTGDARIADVLAALRATGYGGWVVVEQDRAPVIGGDVGAALAADARNAAWLQAALAPSMMDRPEPGLRRDAAAAHGGQDDTHPA